MERMKAQLDLKGIMSPSGLKGATERLGRAVLHPVRTLRVLADVPGLISTRDHLADLVNAYTAPGFTHPPVVVSMAPPWILDPDPPTAQVKEAVRRVVDAYHRAMADFEHPSRSMWNLIEAKHSDFLEALRERRLDSVGDWLARLFQTDLVWGLGVVGGDHATCLRQDPERSHLHRALADVLVSLGEAASVLRVTSIEQQGVRIHQEALHVALDAVLLAIEQKTGLGLSFPPVGAACGFRLAGRLITLDSIIHSYTVHRLRQLGATAEASIAEIGGGYGCLAALCYRAGYRNYTIVDLPWVNVLQGYFLTMALPPGAVRLYGETSGVVAVLPHWCLHQLLDHSLDYVVNTDSLPEIGPETANRYIAEIARCLRGIFLSINQEAKAPNVDAVTQNCVTELIERHGGFRVLARSRAWMRQGYVEEVFAPGPPSGRSGN